jgi:hypothetical protein
MRPRSEACDQQTQRDPLAAGRGLVWGPRAPHPRPEVRTIGAPGGEAIATDGP